MDFSNISRRNALHLFSIILLYWLCQNRKRTIASALFLFAFAVAQINAQPSQHNSNLLAFTSVNIVDVIEGKVTTNQTVIISGDQITGIDHVDSLQIPVHARVIGARGKYLIPGLWDMHVHLDDLPYLHMTPEEKQIALPMYVANGVTGVRDMGGNLNQLNEWRLQARMEEIVAPTIVAAGPYVGGNPPAWPYNILKLSSANEAKKAVRTLSRTSGVDFIKTYTLIPREAYFALSEEANRLGIPFAGHLPVEVTLEEAIEAGQRSFEHGDPIAYRCTERSQELQKIVLNATDMDRDNPDRPRAAKIYLGRDRYVIDSFEPSACD